MYVIVRTIQSISVKGTYPIIEFPFYTQHRLTTNNYICTLKDILSVGIIAVTGKFENFDFIIQQTNTYNILCTT